MSQRNKRLPQGLKPRPCLPFIGTAEAVPLPKTFLHSALTLALTVFTFALLSTSATAQMNNGIMSPPANTRPPRLENVGIEQRLDAQVPPGLIFRDEAGKDVKLGEYFGRKPMILNLVYYNCTMLCGEALAGLASAMRLVKFDVG